jgi:hypothetical protein
MCRSARQPHCNSLSAPSSITADDIKYESVKFIVIFTSHYYHRSRGREREKKKEDFCSDKPFLFISVSHFTKVNQIFQSLVRFSEPFSISFLYCVSLNYHIFSWSHSALELFNVLGMHNVSRPYFYVLRRPTK